MEPEQEAPSLLAFPLGEARAILARAGWSCGEVEVTAPPGGGDGAEAVPDDGMLVVRQRQAEDGTVRLTVARPPGPPQGA